MHELPRVIQSVRELLAAANCSEVGVQRVVQGPTSVQLGGRNRAPRR
jgi:hypothetical protein